LPSLNATDPGDVELTLAEVLWADGQLEAATAARSRAIDLYLQKGNIVAASHAAP
jgi:hypothetical protein